MKCRVIAFHSCSICRGWPVLCGIVLALCLAQGALADRLVLRNLEIIRDKKIVGMNLDGVTQDDGRAISWDEIESGKIDDAERNKLFQKYLENLGIHLYRIRQRLNVGDFREIGPHAEAVAKYYQGRQSETAYMVHQALMWSRLAAGQREAAVEPYLRCLAYLHALQGKPVNLPGDRRLRVDLATGLCDELPPVWFNDQAAKAALPSVGEAIGQLTEPRPVGTRIYYATLAIAAGEKEGADRAIAGIGNANEHTAQLRDIVFAQQEIVSGKPGEKERWLAANIESIDPANKPLALYWLGRAQLSSTDPSVQQQGILKLLTLPAAYGQRYPDLAAAGLHEAMQALNRLGDARGSIAVRGELLAKYPQTFHAHLAKSPSKN
jgi:hypothetical protein